MADHWRDSDDGLHVVPPDDRNPNVLAWLTAKNPPIMDRTVPCAAGCGQTTFTRRQPAADIVTACSRGCGDTVRAKIRECACGRAIVRVETGTAPACSSECRQ